MKDSKESKPNESNANPSAVATEDVLRALGFHDDPGVMTDEPPGLSFDFGNFTLEASQNVNRWLRPVVALGGVMTTNRSSALVHFEMPLVVESFEQGVALVTHCLDSHAGGTFIPASPVPWLLEGRQYRNLLPWNKRSADSSS
jgi:hypothetical protein